MGHSNRSGPIAQLIKATGADVLGGRRCDQDAAMVWVALIQTPTTPRYTTAMRRSASHQEPAWSPHLS